MFAGQRYSVNAMDEALADRPLDQPSTKRLKPSHPLYGEIVRLHREAMGCGEPGYRDPTSGFFAFTAKFLADRGYCCNSGCRHCPFVA